MVSRKPILALIVIIIISVSVISLVVLGNINESSPSDQLDDAILEIMTHGYVPGVAACIVDGESIAWVGCYGVADMNQNTTMSRDTLFMLGSISKVVVCVAFMQLYEQGLIGLDDNVNDYLSFDVVHPSYPNHNITPRMLLSHVSGIRDNWNILGPLQSAGDSPIPLNEFTEEYLTVGGQYYSSINFVYNAPGTSFEYTNVGATLIAYLIEVITGTSFEDYCQESVFLPLNMTESSWRLENLEEDNIATPYDYSGTRYVPFTHYGSPVYPAGFLRTSVVQLARLLTMMIHNGTYNGNSILNSTSVRTIMTLHYPDLSQGYGFCLQYSNPFWGHGGGAPGVATAMTFIPEIDHGVIVLTNGGNGIAANEISSIIWDYVPELVQ